MSTKGIIIILLLFCLFIVTSGYIFVIKRTQKYRLALLIGMLIINIFISFNLVTTVIGVGISANQAISLEGYPTSFYNDYFVEKIKTDDYIFYVYSLGDKNHGDTIITVKKKMFFYYVIDNNFIEYTSDEFTLGKKLNVLSYQLDGIYLHFLKFAPTYFESEGHVGYILPSEVYINGTKVEVSRYLYCYSNDEINSLKVNGYDFVKK